VIYDRKGEESQVNKNQSLQLTTCAGYYLKMPDKSADKMNLIPDPDLGLHSLPSMNARGIIPLKQTEALRENLAESGDQAEIEMQTLPLDYV